MVKNILNDNPVSATSINVSGESCFNDTLTAKTQVDLSTLSGVTTIGSSTPVDISATGILNVSSAIKSSSTSTGCVILNGGMGIGEKLYIGNSETVISDIIQMKK